MIPKQHKTAAVNSSATLISVASPTADPRSSEGNLRAIRVKSLSLTISGAGTIVFRGDATDLFTLTVAGAVDNWVLPPGDADHFWFQAGMVENLEIGNSGGLTITGIVNYIEVENV